MREILIALAVLTVVCTAFLAAMPWLLRKRNVEMRRTKFGMTLVFDAENADGTPVRLINVNGTFQSGCYVPEDLRFQLACEYHREMARVIEDLVARRGRTPDEPLRVLVMGGGGYSLPKYLAAYVPEAHVDVVEIDPAMTALAREFFFLDECLERTGAEKDGRLRLVTGDAWDFVRSAEEPYDVIVNDAFSGKPPARAAHERRGGAHGPRAPRRGRRLSGQRALRLRGAPGGRAGRRRERLWARVRPRGLRARVARGARQARQQRAGRDERQGRHAPRRARRTVAGEKDLSAAGPRDGRSPRCGAAPRAGRSFR